LSCSFHLVLRLKKRRKEKTTDFGLQRKKLKYLNKLSTIVKNRGFSVFLLFYNGKDLETRMKFRKETNKQKQQQQQQLDINEWNTCVEEYE